MISAETLKKLLPACHIHFFDELDSTNTYAHKLAESGAPAGTLVLARRQSAGRGRLGRSFHSPESGIYMSVIVKPEIDSSLITPAAAAAVASAIKKVCGIDAGIKWVNDIYVDKRKVCGILCEGVMDPASGTLQSIVVGIGINTSLEGFPDELEEIAGALTGDYSQSELAAAVIIKLLAFVSGAEAFMDFYREASIVIGETVTVYNGRYRVSPDEELPSRPARVLGIDDNGGLMVIYSDGTRETLISGEISIRLTP